MVLTSENSKTILSQTLLTFDVHAINQEPNFIFENMPLFCCLTPNSETLQVILGKNHIISSH